MCRIHNLPPAQKVQTTYRSILMIHYYLPQHEILWYHKIVLSLSISYNALKKCTSLTSATFAMIERSVHRTIYSLGTTRDCSLQHAIIIIQYRNHIMLKISLITTLLCAIILVGSTTNAFLALSNKNNVVHKSSNSCLHMTVLTSASGKKIDIKEGTPLKAACAKLGVKPKYSCQK